MENNQTIKSIENLAVQVDSGFQGPPDGVVVPAEAEVLHINLGDKCVYFEKPLLFEREILKSAVRPSKKGCLDRKCIINGVSKPKNKRRRCSVITKKKTNVATKTLRRGFRHKSMGFNYPADLLKTSESNILFNIQINKCTVLPTPSKSVDSQKSPDAAQDTGKNDPEATKIASFKLASPVLIQNASTSDIGSSDGYEDKHHNMNSSNISATVSILDEVQKFSSLAILEENETDMADSGTKLGQKDQVQNWPNHKLHENARSKNILTYIKTIKENVSKSLLLRSATTISLAEKNEAVNTAEVESVCFGHEIAKQANSTKSGRILSDIKLLKDMLVKSLGTGACEGSRVVSDGGRDETPNIVKNEMPRDVTGSEGNAREDVETPIAIDKIREDEEIFGRMNISGGERDEMSQMPNSAMRCDGNEPESTKDEQTKENMDSPNTTDKMPVTFYNETEEEISGSMNISDNGRDEMPIIPNIAFPFGGIDPESTTGEGQVRENMDTSNTAEEITANIHDEDDEEFSGIMRIYKNSHLHDGRINSANIETTQTKEWGYRYFCLFNLAPT